MSNGSLAYHEALELHELVAMESNMLITLKNEVGNVPDQELKNLYGATIKVMQRYLKDLLVFFPKAPTRMEDAQRARQEAGYYAGNILIQVKTLIRTYAIAITETATPVLRRTLVNQLNGLIDLHAQIFSYMSKNGLYSAFDMKKLIDNDVKNAQKAIDMKY
ncbi:spore coat protein [Pradoshia eiseniae]|uniref:Spore coat protein n=1 Tax=Pradoshia eiseniae TaxID=2064768 RepID=A0A2S7N052_9BACI|nr:spore coat protein [Pradoshia eiseniae]PQD95377.1 spore coat protein [Pradoshia eiseniae]